MTEIEECLCFVSMSDYALGTYDDAAHIPYISIKKSNVLWGASYSHIEFKRGGEGALGERRRLVPKKA